MIFYLLVHDSRVTYLNMPLCATTLINHLNMMDCITQTTAVENLTQITIADEINELTCKKTNNTHKQKQT